MAAISACQAGGKVTVVEANTSCGRKLLLTGAGRCNLTHQTTPREFIRAFGTGSRFLSYSVYRFSPQHVRDLFARLGIRTKTEEDGCVFPVSGRASDVKDALVSRAKALDTTFLYGKRATDVVREADTFVLRSGPEQVRADKLIIATGGLSWPRTGSTGDGYRFARHFGHSVVKPKASLVPLVTGETWPRELAGTAVGSVRLSANIDNKKVVTAGAMIFTDDGIGGPAVLDMSRYLTEHLTAKTPVHLTVDLAPDTERAQLESQLTGHITENPKKKVVNIMAEFVPRRLSVLLCRQANCDGELPAGQLRKDIRRKLVRMIKELSLTLVRTRPIAEATVTQGGVSIDEVDPKTMESKICAGLFFAGEVLDLDGPCGGYNLQVCWSTGALAGSSAAL